MISSVPLEKLQIDGMEVSWNGFNGVDFVKICKKLDLPDMSIVCKHAIILEKFKFILLQMRTNAISDPFYGLSILIQVCMYYNYNA